MTYGSIPYGTGPYGGIPTEIHLDRAYASSTNSVVVETTTPALTGYGFEDGSALNPATWTLTRLDTGAEFVVLGVRMLDPSTFELWTMEPIAPWQVTHRVKSTSLKSATGLTVTGTNTADCPGVVSDYEPDPGRVPEFARRDLSNPRPGLRSAGVDGTLEISGGDYRSDAEPELTRKLVMRRLTTRRGSIRHLPNFGLSVGVEQPIYGAATATEIRREVVEQVRAEPTVDTAEARVSVSPSKGVVQIDAYYTIRGAPGVTLVASVVADSTSGTIQAK